jgi:regulator of RNase E activity RraA
MFAAVDTTAMCDADKATRVMDSGIRLRSAQPRVLGPAFTVRGREDLLGVVRAIEMAEPGSVIVVDGGGRETALAGELFARGAIVRRLAGIIVDGGYRDIGYISTCPLPVYSRFVTPMAASSSRLGELQVPVTCGGVCVRPGDLIFADAEGILVVEPDRAQPLLEAATRIKEIEARLIEKLEAGSTLSDGLNLDEHVAALMRGEPSSLRFIER